MNDHFSKYHPAVNFVFFFGALLLGMFLLHPLFLICSVLFSALYYLTIKGKAGWSLLLGLLPLFLFLSVVNPIFNPNGSTILFKLPWNRPYTLEALLYGMALAAMMVSVLLWFASYNAVMTSDRFLYLFGGLFPSVTLVIIQVLRLCPHYQKKAEQITGARKGIGKADGIKSRWQCIQNGTDILSTMASWALEGGIMTADSMKSRGYGSGRRTSFSLYRMERRDRYMLTWMLLCLCVTLFSMLQGAALVSYTPHLFIAGRENILTQAGVIAYALFLAIPAGVNVREKMIWHILKSGI